MPRASAPAHMNASRNHSTQTHNQSHASHTQSRSTKSTAHANHSAGLVASGNNGTQGTRRHSTNLASSPTSTTPSGKNASTNGTSTTTPTTRSGLASSSSPYQYTYGTGSGARSYRAYGYGRGYRNRYYGSGYGYGRSQGLNRGIVSRLRSVHASLARIDHDYQGHRVRAMHSVSMAIRQLSSQSMAYNRGGFASGMNNRMGMGQGMGMGMGMGQGGRRSVLGGGRQPMSQAQSDARMSQAMRTLQGIGMQLGNQGNGSMGHGRALGHVQQAVHELNVALSIR